VGEVGTIANKPGLVGMSIHLERLK
jgi:hypothetical protein